jgi:ribonuclease VapC
VIVDSSALLAIIRDEPLAAVCLQTMLGSSTNLISAVSYVEAAIVADRIPNSPDAATFDDLMEQLNIIVEPLTAHPGRLRERHMADSARASAIPRGSTSAIALPTH